MAGSEGRNPIADLESLRREIHLYAPALSKRPWFIVANKMDLPEAEENLRHFKKRFPRSTTVPLSAKEGRGIDELKRLLKEWMDQPAEMAKGHSQAGVRSD
jgi:GTP-binding protein